MVIGVKELRAACRGQGGGVNAEVGERNEERGGEEKKFRI